MIEKVILFAGKTHLSSISIKLSFTQSCSLRQEDCTSFPSSSPSKWYLMWNARSTHASLTIAITRSRMFMSLKYAKSKLIMYTLITNVVNAYFLHVFLFSWSSHYFCLFKLFNSKRYMEKVLCLVVCVINTRKYIHPFMPIASY